MVGSGTAAFPAAAFTTGGDGVGAGAGASRGLLAAGLNPGSLLAVGRDGASSSGLDAGSLLASGLDGASLWVGGVAAFTSAGVGVTPLAFAGVAGFVANAEVVFEAADLAASDCVNVACEN